MDYISWLSGWATSVILCVHPNSVYCRHHQSTQCAGNGVLWRSVSTNSTRTRKFRKANMCVWWALINGSDTSLLILIVQSFLNTTVALHRHPVPVVHDALLANKIHNLVCGRLPVLDPEFELSAIVLKLHYTIEVTSIGWNSKLRIVQR